MSEIKKPEFGVPAYIQPHNSSHRRRGTRRTIEFRTDSKRPCAISDDEFAKRWEMAFGSGE